MSSAIDRMLAARPRARRRSTSLRCGLRGAPASATSPPRERFYVDLLGLVVSERTGGRALPARLGGALAPLAGAAPGAARGVRAARVPRARGPRTSTPSPRSSSAAAASCARSTASCRGWAARCASGTRSGSRSSSSARWRSSRRSCSASTSSAARRSCASTTSTSTRPTARRRSRSGSSSASARTEYISTDGPTTSGSPAAGSRASRPCTTSR